MGGDDFALMLGAVLYADAPTAEGGTAEGVLGFLVGASRYARLDTEQSTSIYRKSVHTFYKITLEQKTRPPERPKA